MRVYDMLCQLQSTGRLEEIFVHHIFCVGLKISFERYCYLIDLQCTYPDETHFHLVQDTSIQFDVSEQTIYKDIGKIIKKLTQFTRDWVRDEPQIWF